ncbi:MAG: hypothetical protein FWE14_01560 [Lachnospiraceae bacterium]|nr:hypothetical protein [Lachnospiraceae bacterium]
MEMLLQNIKIKNTIVPSKIFFAPINTGYSNYGAPTEELIKYHENRSGKRIGISYVGNVAIGKQYCSNKSTCYFPSDKKMWSNLCNVIKKNGSLAGIQIACNNSAISMQRTIINPNLYEYISKIRDYIFNLDIETIELIIDKFIEAINFAKEVGFDIVQIHAAHGYFLSLLLSPIFNCRNDVYGENRSYCIEKIISKSKKENIEILFDVRLSLVEGVLRNANIEKQSKIIPIKKIINAGANIISISNGIYNIDKSLIYPKRENISELCDFIKEFDNNIIWNFSGAIKNLNQMSNILEPNCTISLGRALMADPNYIIKYHERENEIKKCSLCGKCHYYSKGKMSLYNCS